MSLTLADLDDLRRGYRDPIRVGDLPEIAKQRLVTTPGSVHMSRSTLSHIASSHPDVTAFDLLLLPFVIRHGLILRERAKPNVLVCVYQEPSSSRRFVAVLKVAANGHEIWVVSFRRAKPRQTRSWMRRGDVLKTHD